VRARPLPRSRRASSFNQILSQVHELDRRTVHSAEVSSTYSDELPPLSEPLPPLAAEFRLLPRTSTSCGPEKRSLFRAPAPRASVSCPVFFGRGPSLFLRITAGVPLSRRPIRPSLLEPPADQGGR